MGPRCHPVLQFPNYEKIFEDRSCSSPPSLWNRRAAPGAASAGGEERRLRVRVPGLAGVTVPAFEGHRKALCCRGAVNPERPVPSSLPILWLRLLRPKDWIKNVFVLAPLIFAGAFTDPTATRNAFAAAALFCVAASASYVWNDLCDLEQDRRHPRKALRPLACGAVSSGQAWVLLAVLGAVLPAGLWLGRGFAGVIGAYLALNLAYSVWLKKVAVIDLFCVASGFVFRVYGGALAIDRPLTPWMLWTTLSLALYLAAIKRRQELLQAGTDGRLVLTHYTPALLDRYAQVAAAGAILFYGLFIALVRPALSITMPFVLFGMFRYWHLVEVRGLGDSPTEVVWSDGPLVLAILAWGGLCLQILRDA